jgi:hypothetical protein
MNNKIFGESTFMAQKYLAAYLSSLETEFEKKKSGMTEDQLEYCEQTIVENKLKLELMKQNVKQN